jgi:hypothetical protein
MTESNIYKIYCSNCKSECDVEHEMDSHHYEICNCPFCGCEIDQDQVEELEYDNGDLL